MEFVPERNAYLERNLLGEVTRLIHTNTSLFIAGDTAQTVATKYLGEYVDLFGVRKNLLKKIRYSHTIESEQSFTTDVIFIQTEHGLPVWQAGILVQMRVKSFRILSAFSTLQPNIHISIPSKNSITRAESLGEEDLLRLLNFMKNESSGGFDSGFGSLKIKNRNLIIFHHDSKHCICLKIVFALNRIFMPPLHWIAIVEVENLAVLFVREIFDYNEGTVYESDSLTMTGMLQKSTR